MKTRQFLALVILITLMAVPSYAQDKSRHDSMAAKLDTITVTAEKRPGNELGIASSITVVGETRIEDYDLKTTQDLVSMIPNFYVTDTGNGMMTNFASMRGISGGMTGITAIGFYVDDVYYSGLDFGLFDVSRVEVLRGPQGTLYGRNSEAGIVNVVTKKPGDHLEGSVSLEAGSFNRFGATARLSGPVVKDKLGMRAAVNYLKTDSHFENKFDGSDEAGAMENIEGRISMNMTPSERLDVDFTMDVQQYDSPEYATFGRLDDLDNLRKNINIDYKGEADKDAAGAALRLGYKMDGMQLVSVSALRNGDYYSTNDIDFTPIDLMNLTLEKDVTTFSQELRLFSDNDSKLKWITGLFFLSENDERRYNTWMNFMNMGMGMPGANLTHKNETDTTGFAVFGEATYSFTNRLDLTFGLRYDREEKEMSYQQIPGSPALGFMGYHPEKGDVDDTFDAWLPKASVKYSINENIMSYGSLSRGFRSGGFNDKEKLGSSYKPEFTWNYEIGAKTMWFDNKLQVNASLFYIDWTDMQVETLISGGTSVYIDNAAEASSKGAELEIFARPVKGLELVAGAAYTRAEYEDYTKGNLVLDDNRVIDSPEYTLNLGGTYRFMNGIFVNARYTHYGEIYYDPANTKSADSYGLVNGKIGYESGNFDIYLYGKNLLDESYAKRAVKIGDTWYGRSGAPQEIGVSFTCRF